jgi:hypothetical protein
MHNCERADRYAVLLTLAGPRWRSTVPVDGEIVGLTGDGLPRVRVSGHVLATDLVGGGWDVTAHRDGHCT